MLTEIESLIVSVIGGALGGLTIVILMYMNFQHQLKEYLFAKEGFKTRNTIKRLERDIDALKTLYTKHVHGD